MVQRPVLEDDELLRQLFLTEHAAGDLIAMRLRANKPEIVLRTDGDTGEVSGRPDCSVSLSEAHGEAQHHVRQLVEDLYLFRTGHKVERGSRPPYLPAAFIDRSRDDDEDEVR
jgi:hypothetical protein